MRIEAAEARPLRLRFRQPVRTALGEFRERDVVLLRLRDADGATGWGEAAPWPGFPTESAEVALEALRSASVRLAGADLEAGDVNLDAGGPLHGTPAARAALSGALCDLAARRRLRPLRDELAALVAHGVAGAPLGAVALNALLVAPDPAGICVEAGRARSAGYRAAKLKLGALPLAVDLARVRAAREGLGPGVALRGDANGAWTADEALAALEALAECGLDAVEQPVAADDFDGLARLRGVAQVRIAADESAATEEGAIRLIEGGLVDAIVLKPAVVGGSQRALAMADRARGAGIGVVFTHAFESAVGARHALHCAAAWGDASAVHGLATAGLFERDVGAPVAGSAGLALIEAQPGIGISP